MIRLKYKRLLSKKPVTCAILNIFIEVLCESDVASKGLKKVGTEKSEMKIRRNHDILGLLQAGFTTCTVSKRVTLTYSGGKNKKRTLD